MPRKPPSNALIAGLLLAVSLTAYLANGDFQPGNDFRAILYQPIVLLQHGELTFRPEREPFMFQWRLQRGGAAVKVRFSAWDQVHEGRTMAQWRRDGALTLLRERYFLSPTARKGEYANNYGLAPGLTLLPFFAPLQLLFGDLSERPALVWYGGKVAASILCAASVAFLFLAAAALAPRRHAVAVALIYGLCTVVWPVASQAPYQQTPALFFSTLGLAALLRAPGSGRWAATAGLAFACATIIRPPLASLAGLSLLWLAHTVLRRRGQDPAPPAGGRQTVLLFCLAGLLPVAAYLAHNLYTFGSPLGFGQVERAGSLWTSDPWGTPMGHGLAGLLVSPSRGLLVYTPAFLLALWGGALIWRDPRWSPLRPVALTAALVLLVYSNWWSWWGGMTFGPRLLLDITPGLALLLLPVLARASRPVNIALAALCAVSFAAQLLGVCAFNLASWNAREAYAARAPGSARPTYHLHRDDARRAAAGGTVKPARLLVDSKRHRHRLWSVSDSQLLYYLTHLKQARAFKKRQMQDWIDSPLL